MKHRGKATRGWHGARLAWIAAVLTSSLLVAATAIAAPGGEKGKPESQPNTPQGPEGNPGGAQGQEMRADPDPPAGSKAQPQAQGEPTPSSQSQADAPPSKPGEAKQTGSSKPDQANQTGASKTTGQARSNDSSSPPPRSQGKKNTTAGSNNRTAGGESNRGGRERVEGDTRTGDRGVRPQDRGPARWTTYCHSTRSTTNPLVVIRTNNNALWGHDLHHEGDDIIPAVDGECPPGTTPTTDTPPRGPNGTLQRPADDGSGLTPLDGADGDGAPGDGDGLGPNRVENAEGVQGPVAPGRGAPDDGVRGVRQTSPGDEAGDGAGPGIADEDEDGGELPFTGLGLIAILAVALLALSGGIAARRV